MDDRELTIWICAQLSAIPGWVWSEDPEVAYPADKVGIFYGPIPDTAETGVGVRIYGGADDDVEDTKSRRVQLRFRGGRRNVSGSDQLADAAHDHLRRLIREGAISEVTRTSFSPSGRDNNQREERTDNYLFIFDNPEASTS